MALEKPFLDKPGASRRDAWICGGGRQPYGQVSALKYLHAGRGKSQCWLMASWASAAISCCFPCYQPVACVGVWGQVMGKQRLGLGPSLFLPASAGSPALPPSLWGRLTQARRCAASRLDEALEGPAAWCWQRPEAGPGRLACSRSPGISGWCSWLPRRAAGSPYPFLGRLPLVVRRGGRTGMLHPLSAAPARHSVAEASSSGAGTIRSEMLQHSAQGGGSPYMRVEGNFLVRVLREPTRNGALLDLLSVNREGLVSEAVIGDCLSHSDREVVEFQIGGGKRKTVSKTSTPGPGRADSGLLKEHGRTTEMPSATAGRKLVWPKLH